MSQVLAAVRSDNGAVGIASSFEHREAEQLLIEEARRLQRRRHRVIAAVVSVVAAASVAWAVAGAATSPRPHALSDRTVSLSALPVCTASHLHVSLSGQPSGAAGTIYFTLKLLNSGPECTVAPITARGFNTAGSRYVGPWSHVYVTSQTKTVVASGRAAYVPLGVGETGNWPTSLCRAANVNAIRVALAGNHALIGAVAIHTSVCTVTKSLHTQSASLSAVGS